MAGVTIIEPALFSAMNTSRGSGSANLSTLDPKEVWVDSSVGTAATIEIDLGSAAPIAAIALIAIYGAASGAIWSITGGTTGYADFAIKADSALRAVDATGQFPSVSHALWTVSSPVTVRYIRIWVSQPSGNPPLQIGRVLFGGSFSTIWGQEFGAGRKVIDTGSSTRLPSGGFAVVDGARMGSYNWTFGDLTQFETDTLYALMLRTGGTVPILVVEDTAATTGQLFRIHYGLLTNLQKYERRNPVQTRWELSMEEWI